MNRLTDENIVNLKRLIRYYWRTHPEESLKPYPVKFDSLWDKLKAEQERRKAETG